MKKIIAIASAAVLGLGVAACDSATENAAEDQAAATEEAVDTQADAMESAAQGTATEEAVENQADAMRESADLAADAAEDRADTLDSGTPQEPVTQHENRPGAISGPVFLVVRPAPRPNRVRRANGIPVYPG
jgi:hypothetical protein